MVGSFTINLPHIIKVPDMTSYSRDGNDGNDCLVHVFPKVERPSLFHGLTREIVVGDSNIFWLSPLMSSSGEDLAPEPDPTRPRASSTPPIITIDIIVHVLMVSAC